MSAYAPLLAALVALLAGLAIGKAWERYKLRGGKWIDRRRARESPHYILGLNFLVANQIDLAIEELTHAASLDADALEVHMILGNLHREKGQVGKAITVMAKGGYRRLPIVDEKGRATGMITVEGILHYLAEHFPTTIYNLPPEPHYATQQREGA